MLVGAASGSTVLGICEVDSRGRPGLWRERDFVHWTALVRQGSPREGTVALQLPHATRIARQLRPLFGSGIISAGVYATLIGCVKSPNMAVAHVGAREEERAVRAFERLLPGVCATREMQASRFAVDSQVCA